MNVAKTINQLHFEVEDALEQTILKAITIGEILVNQKTNVPHGSWTKWIEDNLTFKPRMARNYIQIYQNKDKLDEVQSVREAVKQIASPKRQRVAVLIPKKSGNEKLLSNPWSKIQQSYTTYHTDYVTICSKKEMNHQNIYEAIGHTLLGNKNGITEVKKYVKRMLVQGESRDRLMEQLDEIEQDCSNSVSKLDIAV
jgi:hypothetical protein